MSNHWTPDNLAMRFKPTPDVVWRRPCLGKVLPTLLWLAAVSGMILSASAQVAPPSRLRVLSASPDTPFPPTSLANHLVTNLQYRTVGIVGSNITMSYLTTPDHGTTFRWKPDRWCTNMVGLSAIACYSQSFEKPNWYGQGGGTLITPQHLVSVKHMANTPGKICRWIGKSGTTYTRTVGPYKEIQLNGVPQEVIVQILDSPLPSDVETVPLLPKNALDYLPQLAFDQRTEGLAEQAVGIMTCQHWAAYPYDLALLSWGPSFSTGMGDLSIWFPSWRVTHSGHSGPQGQPFGPTGGDSGHPFFFLIGNQCVLVGPANSAGSTFASFKWLGPMVDEINLAIRQLSLESGAAIRTVKVYSLQSWPRSR